MTSLSKGTASDYLTIAQLEPLIAMVADEIRQAGGSVQDEVLEGLPWKPFRPMFGQSDPGVQKGMILAAYLAHLEGLSSDEIESRVIAGAS